MTVLALVDERLGRSQSNDLWALIDPKLLSSLGWDGAEVLTFPQGDPIFGWTACKVAGCEKDGPTLGGLCASCRKLWRETGCGPLEEFLKTATPRDRAIGVEGCVVPQCQRPWKSAPSQLCDAHHWQRAKRLRVPMADFLRHPEVVGHPSFGRCDVLACTSDRGGRGPLCLAHRQRAATLARRDPAFDLAKWYRTAPAIPEVGKASLRGLPARLVAEVLYGIQERARMGSKIEYFTVRNLCDKARAHAATSLDEIPTHALSREQAHLLSTFVMAVRRARATPETERHKDVWDLAVFGRTLSFTGISQPWLREAAKRWALDDLPQRRGRQVGAVVQGRINALALLSDRPGRTGHGGLHPDPGGRHRRSSQPQQDRQPWAATRPPTAARPGRPATGAHRMSGNPMTDGRRADSARRRQRVIKAVNEASTRGDEINVSAIACAAGVDRTFLYRHRDLLSQVHTAKPTRRPPRATDRWSAGPRCWPTWPTPKARSPDRQPASGSWSRSCPNCSANRSGGKPAWAPRPTSTSCNVGSPNWNSRSSNFGTRPRSVIRNSKPPGPPTGSCSPT